MVKSEFEKYGEVVQVRMLQDSNCAFVDFASLEDSCRAYDGMQGHLFGGSPIILDFARVVS